MRVGSWTCDEGKKLSRWRRAVGVSCAMAAGPCRERRNVAEKILASISKRDHKFTFKSHLSMSTSQHSGAKTRPVPSVSGNPRSEATAFLQHSLQTNLQPCLFVSPRQELHCFGHLVNLLVLPSPLVYSC